MRHIKSERLKKLELELTDLEQWLKLGLVPKKDVDKHKEEIVSVRAKIEEEKERLQFLKESGDAEDFVAPKRPANSRGAFTDMPTLPDIDIGETQGGLTESSFDMDSEGEDQSTSGDHTEEEDDKGDDDEEKEEEEDEDESYFSDKNRWKRGGIIDPDADEW